MAASSYVSKEEIEGLGLVGDDKILDAISKFTDMVPSEQLYRMAALTELQDVKDKLGKKG